MDDKTKKFDISLNRFWPRLSALAYPQELYI